MQTDPEGEENLGHGMVPADLSLAGAVVDKAIEYMTGRNIGSLAIASALLGGSLGLLARTMGDEAVVRVLSSAIDSVRSGEFRQAHQADQGGGQA